MDRLFTPAYVLFLVLYLPYRFAEKAKVDRKIQRKGIIYNKPIYTAQAIIHLSVGIACILEHFLVFRKPNLVISGLGLILLLTGTFARKTVVKALGKQWSPYIEIKPDHQLIRRGTYQYLRHPNSLFLFLEACGFALLPNAYYMLIVTVLSFIPVTFARIHFEEKALIERFGQEYIDYKKQVPAVLPFKLINRLFTKGQL